MLKINDRYKIDRMYKENAPAAECDPSETVVFETADCADGGVFPDGTRKRGPGFMRNPATGPLYIRGAQPGDVLKVTVEDIKLADTGFMGTNFGSDCFHSVQGEEVYRTFDISDGQVHLGGHSFPVKPMIGVIGIAPEGEGIDTLTPDYHGGNMDCTMIGIGAEVYFPVQIPGALLAIGDLHAAMGDGEVFGYGLEAAGEVTVKVEIIPGQGILKMPLVKRDGIAAAIASADTLDRCSELAVTQLYDLLTSNGWDRTEAGWLMSMKCDLAVCQTVDPKMTVRACIPEELLRPESQS